MRDRVSRVRLRGVRNIPVKGDFIRLDSLLKFASVVSTGGEAKFIISGGEVSVGGEVCVQRGRKIRPGDVVRYGEETLIVRNAEC